MPEPLPNELVDMVLGFVEDLPTLYSLCLVSKSAYSFARPRLYQSISLDNLIFRKKLPAFMRTLLQKPELAKLIRRLDIGEDIYDFEDSWEDPDHGRPGLSAILAHATPSDAIRIFTSNIPQERPPGVPEVHVPHLEEDNPVLNAWIELLLIQIQKLDQLLIVEASDFFHLWRRIRVRYGHLDVLSGIRFINVYHWDTEGGLHLGSVAPLLLMSQPAVLHATSCTSIIADGDENINLTCLKDVRLERTCYMTEDWEALVRWFPQLEVLIYLQGDAVVGQYTGDEATPREVGRALQALRTTLREFTYDSTDRFEADEYLPFESLRELTALKKLTLAVCDLTSPAEDEEDVAAEFLHKLPHGLESLNLILMDDSDYEIEVRELQKLVYTASADFPHLKNIGLVSSKTHDDLQQEFKLAGIECEVLSYNEFIQRL